MRINPSVRFHRRIAAISIVSAAAGLPMIGTAIFNGASASSAASWTAYATASGSSTITPITGAGTASPSLGSPITAGSEVTNATISRDGTMLFAANSAANSKE